MSGFVGRNTWWARKSKPVYCWKTAPQLCLMPADFHNFWHIAVYTRDNLQLAYLTNHVANTVCVTALPCKILNWSWLKLLLPLIDLTLALRQNDPRYLTDYCCSLRLSLTLPLGAIYVPPVVVTYSFRVTVYLPMAVWLFLLQARLPGTLCVTNSVNHR